ncbi:MAG TPA: hybrid sensor histidine kinase/response regulator [Verrucomicrobiae bacterium]|jgi:two-component system probable response regulator PhcQ
MQPQYDYKKFAILYVDDEEKSLKSFERAFRDEFRILTASNARDGLALLEAHRDELAVLITDQRMPSENGVWLLERARQLQPRLLRILASAYSDLDAAIAAVNAGAIYKYVTKPWDPPELEMTIKRALEFFIVQKERDQLLRDKMTALHNVVVTDRILSLGLMAAGLSHHIRNALVAVKTFLDLAPTKLKEERLDLDALRNPDFWKDYHQNVLSQIDRINHLLKELWAASEQPAAVFTDSVKLHEIVGSAITSVTPVLAAKNITVRSDISDVLPALLADARKLRRLFELLLKDESVSLPAGSRIDITARPLPQASGQPQTVEIRITDNGPGLPQDALRLLFDPFVARSDSPSEYGINLMAAFFIAHHHGGKVEAQANDPHGTVFIIQLPVNPNAPASAEEDRELIRKAFLNEELWEKVLRAE